MRAGSLSPPSRSSLECGYPHHETPGRPTAGAADTSDARAVMYVSRRNRKMLALLAFAAPVVAAILVALSTASHGG